jgi:hypothetical protein
MGFDRLASRLLLAAPPFLTIANALGAESRQLGPEEVLTDYLTSCINPDSTDTKRCFPRFSPSREYEFRRGSPTFIGETASYPVVVTIHDRFLNDLPVEELVVYSLLLEGDRWKVDGYRVLNGTSEAEHWFPGVRPSFCGWWRRLAGR